MTEVTVREDGVRCSATFSPDRVYRYTLTRAWEGDGPLMVFIGLNPSTAIETEDDNTIRRCMGFARREGAAGIVMLNVFAFRATDPRTMRRADDPIGPMNDVALEAWARNTTMDGDLVVACWGVHGDHRLRGRHVHAKLREWCPDKLRVFGVTKDGHPKHPLYLPRAARLEVWR